MTQEPARAHIPTTIVSEVATHPSVRVVVVDDQPTIRLGLTMILDNEPDITVVGEAKDGQEALDVVRALRPDVVLMDIRMPRLDGVEATRILTADPTLADVRTIVLTTFNDEEYLFGALRAGASGFLLKDVDPATLITAIHRVHAGDSLLDPSVTRSIIERYVELFSRDVRAQPAGSPAGSPSARTPGAALMNTISPRERDVLLAVVTGGSNRDIAAGLFLTEATVKSHIRSLLTKLGLTSRVQLVVAAYESGLVSRSAPS
ncbi:two component transcriptional regulator, LuxR family [Sanguibacter gelidistatuariae]|uniref:Two component transcriptional regulator, LuxR family n=1 Tax=Sanguibacter gelidistatuariae TaxID=1814289 RepID=A0A1G6QGV3_9MICO|nr:response regulator transcription factor [Sanguibacter gelidistatuariae]SDC91154.1 two component transcriptional regulator, LuxR family [Sanguibacter gelidistatuariae]